MSKPRFSPSLLNLVHKSHRSLISVISKPSPSHQASLHMSSQTNSQKFSSENHLISPSIRWASHTYIFVPFLLMLRFLDLVVQIIRIYLPLKDLCAVAYLMILF